LMAYEREITSARHIIDDDERKLALMRRLGASWDRMSHFQAEIDAWKRRLRNLEAAAR
jgi:hypothetical protein